MALSKRAARDSTKGPAVIVQVSDDQYAIQRDGRYLCEGRGHSLRRSWSRELYRAWRGTHDEAVALLGAP